MKFKKLESGRSMVEMLGVLAIIGVLSVGGIAGYGLAMRKHRANGVMDYISKFAVSIYSNCYQEITTAGGNIDTSNCRASRASYLNDDDYPQPDVGPIPAGVKFLYVTDILGDSANSIDGVAISTIFSDEKLCKDVSNIAGSTCRENGNNEYHSEIIVKIE